MSCKNIVIWCGNIRLNNVELGRIKTRATTDRGVRVRNISGTFHRNFVYVGGKNIPQIFILKEMHDVNEI